MLVGRAVGDLFDGFVGDFLGFYAYQHRVVHVFVGQFGDFVGQGGREQQVEAFFRRRHPAQQKANVFDEAEVEHAVGFVKHHDLYVIQRQRALFVKIDDAAGGADDDVDRGFDFVQLLLVVDAAIEQGVFEIQKLADVQRVFVNLDGQFAGGGENNGSWILDFFTFIV